MTNDPITVTKRFVLNGHSIRYIEKPDGRIVMLVPHEAIDDGSVIVLKDSPEATVIYD